jgi:hypothetical protein
MLKNLGENYLKVLVHLFNTSIQKGKAPKRWKKGIVKTDAKDNPNSYRPITLTNCLSRVCERVLNK